MSKITGEHVKDAITRSVVVPSWYVIFQAEGGGGGGGTLDAQKHPVNRPSLLQAS